MPYSIKYGNQFLIEFERYLPDQQTAILNFVDIYEQYGLDDFDRYRGKITPSWKGADPDSPEYRYARDNHLWHYHVGYESYTPSRFGKYETSKWVLHFIWDKRQNYIVLVDLAEHYRADQSFYIPGPKYLLYTLDVSFIDGLIEDK